VEVLREPVRVTAWKPDIARLLPVYVADRYEGVEARTYLEISDAEIEELVQEQATIVGDDAEATLLKLRETGRFEQLRDDLRLRNALDRIASEVKRIPKELAEARDQIWTPEKEKQQTDTKLWTPGS
jgi:hypothetical protein